MKPIVELGKRINLLEDAKESIIDRWVSYEEATEVLENHNMPAEYFKEHFASDIFNYYVSVVRREKQIGDCPVMAEFLNYLKEHDISSAELFLICTHFRKSMLDELFEAGQINKELFDEVSYVFDLNFSGVLDQYTDRLYTAQRETKIHKRRFEQYNTAIDQSAMVCKVDLDGFITYVNPRFCELSGYTKEELLGATTESLRDRHQPSELADEMWEQLNNKEIFHGTVKSVRKDGTPYYTELTVVPMLDLEGNVEEYLSIRYDVSELVDVRDAALQAERTKDMFLANMSHEIRTPLNAILGFVSILRKRVTEKENLHYLDIIDSSGKNLLSIIGDILDFAKIREGKLNIDPHFFNPVKELSTVLALFNSKTMEKNIEYLTYLEPGMPISIKADSVRLKQILTNFLSNAVKFTPDHGCISVSVMVVEGRLVIEVKDSGCGIEKEAMSRIFSEFEQAEGSTTRNYGGTGLGLSISKYLSDMMGGEISVESELGKGSMFRLSIPVEVSHERNCYNRHRVYIQKSEKKPMQLLTRYLNEMEMSLAKEPEETSLNFYDDEFSGTKIEPSVTVRSANIDGNAFFSPPFTAYEIMSLLEDNKNFEPKFENGKLQYIGHILVAEDNKANQLLIQIILEEYGLSHVLVSNGQEAYEKFQEESFDLVLIDEQMPVMGGLEAAKKIAEYEHEHKLKHTPIVSVTANALKDDEKRFLAAGMDAYVAKPIDSTKLEEILNKFIPQKEEEMRETFELPSYGNINAEEMAAKIGLNARHIPILVQSFIDESTQIMGSLEAAIEKKDYAEIGNTAHSIKGSAGNLKFDEMYELAKEVELSAKAAKEDYPYVAACASLKNAISSIKI